VFPRIIEAFTTLVKSLGRIPLTVACVPTGIKTGVETSPPGKKILPVLACLKHSGSIADDGCIINQKFEGPIF
jgi:hypothetical protein